MRLYHGSNGPVPEPRISGSRHTMDLGSGFYVSESLEQAERWAKAVVRRRKGGVPTVTEYECDGFEGSDVLAFDGPTGEWFDFVISNRDGDSVNDCDIVISPVADDDVHLVLFKFEEGILSREQAIDQIGTARLGTQIVFRTERSLDHLEYIGHREA